MVLLQTLCLVIIFIYSCVQGHNKNLEDQYDFIIVGGGSAGSVVASRLSEDPSVNVLLLEAGGIDPLLSLIADIPLANSILKDSVYDWQYITVPQKNGAFGFKEQILKYPRGKTLGGSSAINEMLYVRGSKRDYDNWASLGNKGWSFEDVLPYFKKSEDNRDPILAADVKYHSTGGYLTVETQTSKAVKSELLGAFIEAGKQNGFIPGDYNGEFQTRISPYQMTIRNGERCSTAKAFLEPALKRPNLKVIQNALVTRVLFDDSKRASGVLFVTVNNTTYKVEASKEVILSCGAIGSPQLLMLSGVGQQQHLKEHGIPVVLHAPGVGENFQDHITNTGMIWTLKKRASISLKKMTDYLLLLIEVIALGPPMLGSLVGTLFMTSELSDDATWPDTQVSLLTMDVALDLSTNFQNALNVDDVAWNVFFRPLIGQNCFGLMLNAMRPKSIGSIRLRSKNPYDKPFIDPNYLNDEHELNVMVSGMKRLVKLGNSESFKKYGASLYTKKLPGCNGESLSDDYFKCLIRFFGNTYWHPVGTCKMGVIATDPMAVVDPELRVHGVSSLRVIDASIMPIIPSGNTNAPTIMIAEKGSDLIKQKWHLR